MILNYLKRPNGKDFIPGKTQWEQEATSNLLTHCVSSKDLHFQYIYRIMMGDLSLPIKTIKTHSWFAEYSRGFSRGLL